MLSFIIVGCLLSATLADLVNLHQIVGGFIFGIMLPKDNLIVRKIRGQLLDFIIIILLPVYFVQTGMNASINLKLDVATAILSCILILISIIGKYSGAWLAGKYSGFNNQDVLLFGSLLSIRGVLEVAILNIGVEVGLINHQAYSALVVMVLVTTWMATSISLHFNKQKTDNGAQNLFERFG